MSYAVTIYVDAEGNTYGASQTDQSGRRNYYGPRTVGGRPVAYAGRWYGVQMSYRPYRAAVEDAAASVRSETRR